MFNQLNGNTGRHYPVRPGFHRRRRVGIDHHGTVRVGITEGGELINRATEVKGAFGIQRRHQYGFSGLRIFAVSPMKRTPATSRVEAGCLAPKRAISRESEIQPPVSSASC